MPLKIISVSLPCASIVIFPDDVASVTAASPVVISSAAAPVEIVPHDTSVPSDFNTVPFEPIASN